MRVPFDSLCLRAVTQELGAALAGWRVERVRQPEPCQVIVQLRVAGRQANLLLDCSADMARIHAVTQPKIAPSPPPPFCMALRKHLEGARLTGVSQVDFDRVVSLGFARAGSEYTLIAELMGRHSNIVLLDPVRIILASCKVVTSSLSRYRTVQPGVAYVPPPPPRGDLDPATVTPDVLEALGREGEDLEALLLQRMRGCSAFLASLLAARARRNGLQDAWRSVFETVPRGQITPVIVRDSAGRALGAYPVSVAELEGLRETRAGGISEALEKAYEEIAARKASECARASLERDLTGVEAALRREQNALEQALESGREAQRLRQYGDLLLAAGSLDVAGQASVTVSDLFGTGDAIEIPLDPERSVIENAQSYYAQARKAEAAASGASQRLNAVRRSLELVAEAKDRLSTLETPSEITSLRDALVREGVLRRAWAESGEGKKPPPKLPRGVRRYVLDDRWEVLLGMSAEGNDQVLRMAAPDDLWFHARGTTSSHAILRTGGKPHTVPVHILRAVAAMVAGRSSAKHSSYVPVDYAPRKYVRRPRGSRPGTVLYTHAKTIGVTPEEPS